MTPHKKRVLVIVSILSVAMIFGGVFIYNFLKAQAKPPKKAEPQAKIKRIKTVEVSYSVADQNLIESYGRVQSEKQINLSAEVGGQLLAGSIALKEGNSFRQGQILFKIDNRIAYYTLQSSKSDFITLLASTLPDVKYDYNDQYDKWINYYESIDLEKNLPELPEFSSSKEKTFFANKGVLKQYYSIKSDEVRLGKYSVRAPFTGSIQEVFYQEGANVNVGAQILSIISSANLEVEIPVDPSFLPWLDTGQEVQLSDSKSGENYKGKITRIAESINSSTQSVNVYASITSGDRSKLFDGSYLNAKISANDLEAGFVIPRKALVNNNQVYVYQDGTIAKEKVEIIKLQNEIALIKGIKKGIHVVVEPLVGDPSTWKVSEAELSDNEYKAMLK